MQRSVLDDGLVVLEPDFLIDISALAALFTEYGRHPLLYTVNRMLPRANSQAILLGNFADTALDDIINQADFSFGRTLTGSFREQALQFCTCPDFSPTTFKADALRQVENLKEVVRRLFKETERSKAVLEPSFVCKKLGLQGRVDLMTTDLHLLVEQKSGKLWSQPLRYRNQHYIQLLLYYGVLRYNFGLSDKDINMYLLYSRYGADEGLMEVHFDEAMFREAIALRNRVVELEIQIAHEGFGSVLPKLNVEYIYNKVERTDFFRRYIEPKLTYLQTQLSALNPTERDYLEQQMTFVYREQLYRKNPQPTSPKGDEVRWLKDLILTDKQPSSADSGFDLLTLKGETGVSDFRRGDMVCLYAYNQEPNIQKSLLYRGRLMEIGSDGVVVKLNDGQQNSNVFEKGKYAIEHDTSDISTTSAIRSLMAFAASPSQKRQLLLGQREPQHDLTQQLTHSYHPDYDEIVLRQKQARDYFLLIGPPGTGKTSMALRFIVQEELSSSTLPVLLMAYTNRAVDEICSMLTDAGIDFLRLGNEASCDSRFKNHLLDNQLSETPRLDAIRQQIRQARVVVSTTATMQACPFIFQLKHFSLCVVDEASQILEPDIIGLLANDAIDRFVLIGDYKQLPAVVQQPGQFKSLFERLIRWERQQNRELFMGILHKQGRMHPEVAQFANEMFYAREQLEPVPLTHQTDTTLNYNLQSEDALDDILKTRRVVFMDAGANEAALVADLLRRIWRFYGENHFDSDKTVGIIVPYRYQIALIRRELERFGIPALLQVSIDTVERYQGSQRDVIIYSFAVEQVTDLDFLTATCFEEDGRIIDRKLNVALTRARKQLLITGCTAILQHNPLFAELIKRYAI